MLSTIIAALQAASSLVPVLVQAIPIIEGAFKSDPAPVSGTEASTVFAALEAAEGVLPALAPIAPIVAKQFAGTEITQEELTALEGVAAQLESQISAKESTIEAAETA
jgi:hypothetical protein